MHILIYIYIYTIKYLEPKHVTVPLYLIFLLCNSSAFRLVLETTMRNLFTVGSSRYKEPGLRSVYGLIVFGTTGYQQHCGLPGSIGTRNPRGYPYKGP